MLTRKIVIMLQKRKKNKIKNLFKKKNIRKKEINSIRFILVLIYNIKTFNSESS